MVDEPTCLVAVEGGGLRGRVEHLYVDALGVWSTSQSTREHSDARSTLMNADL